MQKESANGSWQVYFGGYFYRAKLEKGEKSRCLEAITKFQKNYRHPGLNLESLSRQAGKNHYSIRASKELRVILALDEEHRICMVMHMGHHDEMYDWSERQGYHTDLDDKIADVNENVTSGFSLEKTISALLNLADWILFLHPEQESLAKARYPGTVRIRGAAGTGKTVLALHRAVALGRRYPDERVLFTSVSRSLCVRLKLAFEELPDAPDNIDFFNIDKIARRYVNDRPIDQFNVKSAVKAACDEVVPGSSIENLDRVYLREEIEKVIKGRAPEKHEYLDTDRFERLGRQRPFGRDMREVCWHLAERWDQKMDELGTTSFPNLMIEARNRAWERDSPTYRAVIVDEGQDMTLVGIQLVRALVAGAESNLVPRDGVLILDDGEQRIYAGGFRLKWAKLNVKGVGSEVFEKNYRNTPEIVKAAKVVRDACPAPSDGDGNEADLKIERKSGSRPIFYRVPPKHELLTTGHVLKTLLSDGFKEEEIAVLSRSRNDILQAQRFLEGKNELVARVVNLERSRDGALPGGIRFGTLDRAKGWEFRAVVIIRLGASQFPKIENRDQQPRQVELDGLETTAREPSAEEEEARILEIGRLYVGMTRARDRLYLIADEEPCEELLAARDYFEWRRSPVP